MSDTAALEIPVTVRLTVKEVAQLFCQFDDDRQAKFFVEVAAIMDKWPTMAGRAMQAHYIGRHLATCECSTQSARDFITEVHDAMEPPT